MGRKLFGPGARGDLIGNLQRALIAAGQDPRGVDEFYGNYTKNAVIAFQHEVGLKPTGVVDVETWTKLMRVPVPAVAERVLAVTINFEGHSYGHAVGDFDGAWLTWGIVGFTMKHGEVQRIILEVNDINPALLSSAFGPGAHELLSICRAQPAEQAAWCRLRTATGGSLIEPWVSQFRVFGEMPVVRAVQRKRAFEGYYQPALRTATKYGLRTESGLLLAFDIHVQNGGIKPAAAEIIRTKSREVPNERARREIIANAVADCAKPEWREDVRDRKLTIARGFGRVHGRDYILENWGIGELASEAAVT